MRKTTPVKIAAAFGAATLLAVAAPLAASAHVTVNPSSTAAASYSVLTFSVGHGCDGSPTTSLTFSIPESIPSVTPTVNPGWTITESGNQITYTADTPLPDDRRTTFELSVKLPDAAAGEQLAFPVLQQCEVGSTDWAEVAAEGEGEPASPAPLIVLTESTGDGHGHSHDDDAAPDAPGTDEAQDEAGSAAPDASSSDDVIARVLGIGGLVLGTVGLIVGLRGRRNEVSK